MLCPWNNCPLTTMEDKVTASLCTKQNWTVYPKKLRSTKSVTGHRYANSKATPNWQEAGQLPIYKCGWRVELGSAVKQLQALVDRGQTREICEKQEKYFKAKAVILYCSKFDTFNYQYPVLLLTVLEIYLKSSTYLKMRNFGLIGAICQGNFVRLRSI